MNKIFAWIVLIGVLLTTIHVAGYDTCWDGNMALDYTGTETMTASGRTCQAWASDIPHGHSWHGGSPLFPNDGNDVNASNYCRDPNGDQTGVGTWCFTTDPTLVWDWCVIPICPNLPCPVSGTSIGPATPSSGTLDGLSGTNFLLTDTTTYKITCCGTVQAWRVYFQAAGTIRLQIWRAENGTGNYELLGENVVTYAIGQQTETVTQSDRISVEEDDLIGWYNDLVPYAAGSINGNILLTTAAPSVGDSVDFGVNFQDGRDYAIGVLVIRSLSPSFTNIVNTATISQNATIDEFVFTLSYTDQDPDDVTSLVLTMPTNTYFKLSGNDVVVKAALAVGTETLDFRVTDHCSEFGVFTLTVTVTAVPVTITSLPDSVNVSESTTAQTPLHTIVVIPTIDTYNCVIDSYLPTRPEGNPFLISNTPSADNGIYLQSAANIRHNTATQLNVTVTCTNSGATDSDTSYLRVNVDPNSHPEFTSVNNSATFSARSTPVNDVVYTATVTDAENDPITMSLACDPPGCPLAVNNDKEVYVTAVLSLHQQSTYVVILTADDGFNSVDSSNISVVITDINFLATFTNLPGPAPDVDENQAVGTSVFQVSSIDANGDTVTYSTAYSNTDCAAMYDIDSGGLVTTKIVFDYDTPTTKDCTLMISAFDGYGTSDTQNLTVSVGNVDEPPVMSGSAFTISTEEVPDNTALPDQSIGATDPESTAVILSMDCGANNGHLAINPTTGIVTMTTAFDLEIAGVDTYTILCTITATDAASLTSTASLSVVVTDANGEHPVFTSGGYSASIVVGYSDYGIILTVSATDADRTSPNNDFTYSLTPTTEFDVTPTGNIYNTADLSAVAAGTTYTLTVTVSDGGTPPLTNSVPVTIIVSTTATTAATTTASSSNSGSGSGSGSTDFFESTGNIILLAIVCFLALIVSAVLGLLIWRYCARGNSEMLPRFRPEKAKLHPQTKAPEAPEKNLETKINNDVKTRNDPFDDNYERAQNYHRPRYVRDIARERFRPTKLPEILRVERALQDV